MTEDDEKIIDFNLWCGEAFPRKIKEIKPVQHDITSTVCLFILIKLRHI